MTKWGGGEESKEVTPLFRFARRDKYRGVELLGYSHLFIDSGWVVE